MTDQEFRDLVVSRVASFGFTAISDLVDMVPISKLRSNYGYLEFENEDEGEDYDEDEDYSSDEGEDDDYEEHYEDED